MKKKKPHILETLGDVKRECPYDFNRSVEILGYTKASVYMIRCETPTKVYHMRRAIECGYSQEVLFDLAHSTGNAIRRYVKNNPVTDKNFKVATTKDAVEDKVKDWELDAIKQELEDVKRLKSMLEESAKTDKLCNRTMLCLTISYIASISSNLIVGLFNGYIIGAVLSYILVGVTVLFLTFGVKYAFEFYNLSEEKNK